MIHVVAATDADVDLLHAVVLVALYQPVDLIFICGPVMTNHTNHIQNRTVGVNDCIHADAL